MPQAKKSSQHSPADALTQNALDEAELNRFLEHYPILDQDTFNRYHERWQKQGDQRALRRIYYGNRRLVIWIANGLASLYGYGFDELYEEGMALLLKVLENFDPKRGFTFSTYARSNLGWRILRKMEERQANGPHVPIYMQFRLQFIARSRAEYIARHRREPTDKQLVKWMLASKKGGKEGKKAATLEMVRESRLIHLGQCPSIDQPLFDGHGDPEGRSLGDLFEDENRLSANTVVWVQELLREYEAVLERLEQGLVELNFRSREDEVLRYRLCWGVRRRMTLDEISRHFGLSRERIRQFERLAIQRLCATYEVTEDQLRGLIAGAAALREIVGDEKRGPNDGLNVPAFCLGLFPELVGSPEEFIPALRDLGWPREIEVEPPVLVLMAEPPFQTPHDILWTVIATLAAYYQLPMEKVVHSTGLQGQKRLASKLLPYLLHHTAGWDVPAVSRVILRAKRIIGNTIAKIDQRRQTDAHFDATVQALITALQSIMPKLADECSRTTVVEAAVRPHESAPNASNVSPTRKAA